MKKSNKEQECEVFDGGIILNVLGEETEQQD